MKRTVILLAVISAALLMGRAALTGHAPTVYVDAFQTEGRWYTMDAAR